MGRGLKLADTAFLKNSGVTPLSFPGLLRWYKADSYSGIANDGDSIGGGGNTRGPWIDQTGSGDDATAAAGPLFRTNIEGTMPIIRFSGAGPAMLFAPGALAGDLTVVCACRSDGSGSLSDGFIFYNNVTAHQLRTQFFNSHDVVFFDGVSAPSAFFGAAHPFEVVGCKRSAGTVTFRQNTTLFAGGAAAGAWTVVQIGNGTGNTMDIGEILLYNTALTEANLDQLYNEYLKPRWTTLP